MLDTSVRGFSLQTQSITLPPVCCLLHCSFCSRLGDGVCESFLKQHFVCSWTSRWKHCFADLVLKMFVLCIRAFLFKVGQGLRHWVRSVSGTDFTNLSSVYCKVTLFPFVSRSKLLANTVYFSWFVWGLLSDLDGRGGGNHPLLDLDSYCPQPLEDFGHHISVSG